MVFISPSQGWLLPRGYIGGGGRLISHNKLPFLPQSWKSNMGPSNGSYLSNTAISHFHDHPVKPLKTKMSLNKADYFSISGGNTIFQPLIFRKSVSFQGSILFPLKLVKLWWPHTTDFLQMVVKSKGNPRLFQGNLGWWNTIIWPDVWNIYLGLLNVCHKITHKSMVNIDKYSIHGQVKS